MFGNILFHMMNCIGIEERDIEYLLRSKDIMTDEQIFVISDFLNKQKMVNIFFTKKIGDISISVYFFDIAVYYEFKKADGTKLATIDINFQKKTFYITYGDDRVEVYNDLLDYEKGKKSNLMDLRMRAMNELLIRYYKKIIYTIYIEIRRGNRWCN